MESGFFGGIKSLERRFKANSVLNESARTEGEFVRTFRSPKRRKALKGQAQERWELKEASKGRKANPSVSG
jgi:hypothetical protein